MDREKAIEELGKLKKFGIKNEMPGIARLSDDAIALLKEQEEQIKNRDESLEKAREEIKWLRGMLQEQEAKNVVNMTLSKDRFLIASCPKCNALLTRVEHKNYCGYCGQAVKWNEVGTI